MQRRIYAALAGMILIEILTGCRVSEEPPPPTAALTSVSVTPSDPSIAPTTTAQLTAWGIYSNGGTQNLTTSATWTSSDTNIAGISASGLATAGSTTGSTVITAVYSGITGSTLLTISETVSVSLSPPTPKSLARGMTQQFSALGTLANSVVQNLTTWVSWASSNEAAAGISSSGLATAVGAPGSTTISGTFSDVTGSVTLTTSPVATISTSPSTASIAEGTSQQFTASGTLDNGTRHDLTNVATWSSSNEAIATISNAGLATSHATGTTFITAAYDGISSSPASTLVVTPVVLTSIATSPTSTSIPEGKDQQYTAIGTFSNSSTQDITATATWSSTNTTVATISNVAGSKGLASSHAQGTATIRATLSGITSNNAVLLVTEPALVSIEVTPQFAHIFFPTSTKQFTAVGTYTNGDLVDLTSTATWVSSDTNIVTTVSNGLVTVLGWGTGGTTNITAEVSGITSNIATLMVSF